MYLSGLTSWSSTAAEIVIAHILLTSTVSIALYLYYFLPQENPSSRQYLYQEGYRRTVKRMKNTCR